MLKLAMAAPPSFNRVRREIGDGIMAVFLLVASGWRRGGR
jgi:hypothetical protein